MADDELQEIRDNFYVGNYQKAAQVCEITTGSNDFAQAELGAIIGRCCLGIPDDAKLKTMQQSEIHGQKACFYMKHFMIANTPDRKQKAQGLITDLATSTQDMSCAQLAAITQAMQGDWAEAVKTASMHPTQEMQALCIFFCLCCNQIGMAEKRLQEMGGQNDDSASYRLASAAVKLATGDPEEAYLTYCDLVTQFPPVEGEDSGTGSVLLQTGKALANMQRGMYAEAVEDLDRALAVAPNDPDVLVNLCCCMTHTCQQAEFDKYYAQLEQVAPSHPYVKKTQGIKDIFARFKASNA